MNIWRCNGGAAEQWTAVQDDTLRIHGKCLAAPGMARGARAELRSCSGSAAQTWRARPDGTVRIHSKCLAVSRWGAVSGTLVELRTCADSRSRWRMVPDRGGVSLVNPATGLCLADPGDARASGTRLAVVTCSAGDPGMAWRIH